MPLTMNRRTDRKAAMPKTKTTMDTLKPRKVNPRTRPRRSLGPVRWPGTGAIQRWVDATKGEPKLL